MESSSQIPQDRNTPGDTVTQQEIVQLTYFKYLYVPLWIEKKKKKN